MLSPLGSPHDVAPGTPLTDGFDPSPAVGIISSSAGEFAHSVVPVEPTAPSDRARERFTADATLLLLPVVDGHGVVVGILNRFRFLERFATRFGRELAAHKSVGAFMERPLLLDEATPVDEAGRTLLQHGQHHFIYDGFVVTRRGRYLGVGTGFDVFRVFTERRHAELQYRAHHDPLTGLPNRALFEERLARVLRQGDGRRAAVLFVDLDRFKELNDTYGHRFGDLVLCAVSGRLRGTVRSHDLVARLSGDEFAIIVEGVHDAEDVARLAQVLVVSCSAPLLIDRAEVAVSCSVGVALCPEHGSTPDRLTRAADVALYSAKEVRNRWQLYVPELEEVRAPVLIGALRQALERRQLEVHYQPIVCLRTNQVTGVEALVRWTHPDAGPVPAAHIVKLAEDSGLVVPLGAFVLETGIAQMQAWERQTGRTDLTLAVNVSALQVREGGLITLLDRVVATSGFDARRLELEFTETGTLRDAKGVDHVFQQLSERGFELTLDDFGTGYSALSRLERLPIHTVKIDRSFVHGIGTERRGGTIAQAIVAMGRSLGLRVIAEGVETEQQRAFLASSGCDAAQGYLLGRPRRAHELAGLLSLARHGRARASTPA